MPERKGEFTIQFSNQPAILGYAAVVGKKEGEGPLGNVFDHVFTDTTMGEKTWEKAESALQKHAATRAIHKAGLSPSQIQHLFAGDLLNQCTASTFGLRELGIPLYGQFGACSTMAQTLSLAAIFVDSGAADLCCAVTSSHFCTAERQFRYPLEYGGQRTPTAQWTVTGAGSAVIGRGKGVHITEVLAGRQVDLGVTDTNNMGAAMAPDDVKIRPYPTNEGMVFFYTQIQYLRGFRALFKYFHTRKKHKNYRNRVWVTIFILLQKKEEVKLFYEYLVKTFGYDSPFAFSEIDYPYYSCYQISRGLRKLCEDKKIVRFEKGLYYIPNKRNFGISIFQPIKVVEKKFIKDGEKVFGYYSGSYLQYELGISKLKPATIEIYTNVESRDLHKVKLGNYQISLRKPRTKIDKHNAPVLCFLELMNGIDVETLDEYKRKLISDYINENRITQKQITKYIPYFPDKTCRNLIESEVIYRVPQ